MLTIWGNAGQVLGSMSVEWGGLVFPHGVGVFRGKTTERNCCSPHTSLRAHPLSMADCCWLLSPHWGRVCCVSPLPRGPLWKEEPALEGWELMLHFLRADYLHTFLKILLHGRFDYFPRFILLFNHVCWDELIGYLFYTLGYNAVLLYLFCFSDCSFEGSCCFPCSTLAHSRHSAGVHVCVLSTFLLSVTVRCFRVPFYISWLSSRASYSSKDSLVLFYRRVVIETKTWVLGVLIATGR